MTLPSDDAPVTSRPSQPIDLLAVRVFVAALMALLVGYMFLGRGFAHLGVPPVYVGEVVLFLGLMATAIAFVRLRLRPAPSRLVSVLLLFMVLGAVRTIPYLGQYGADALRDAVLWGYGLIALIIFVLADRNWVLRALRAYGWVVPVFALWLPIAWVLFDKLGYSYAIASDSDIPILYFKNQDMAVHTVGAIAFLVVGSSAVTTRAAEVWRFVVAIPLVGSSAVARWTGQGWRFVVAIPLAWAVVTTGSFSRGALAAVIAGVVVLAVSAPRSRHWLPIIGAAVLVGVFQFANIGVAVLGPGPSPSPVAPGVETTPPSAVEIPSPTGRDVGPEQWVKNLTSIIVPSNDENLEGTKNFRLAWWEKIIGYTVVGPYFWTGKGFGVNLADDDGFQPNPDHSLRTPHNAHFDVLARMGVPGFVLWMVLQLGFFFALVRSILAYRRAGDQALFAVAAWILVYWTAMMVDTSFDPYLEGPQGGIWYWVIFGLGLVVIRTAPRRREV